MNLQKVLGANVIRPQLSSKTKSDVINELLGILVATGKVSDKDVARTALLERERKMSTGMQHGIAIPHGKTEAVDALIACVGVSREGIDFGSLDGEPARIFIMTLSPSDRTGPHLQFLAAFMRRRILNAFRSEEFFVTRVDHDRHIYRIRKDEIVFTVVQEEDAIAINLSPAHE